MTKLALSLAAVAALATVPGLARADSMTDADSGTRSVAVSYADLDLSTAQGVRLLSVRMDRAALKACGLSGPGALSRRDSVAYAENVDCIAAAHKQSAARVRSAIAAAQTSGPALAAR